MSDHRGAHPEDDSLFAPSERSTLRAAVRDLSWLRGRGYGGPSARKLVGDRYRLRRRQRNAVARSACGGATVARRTVRRRRLGVLSGTWLEVDGFNVLITIEGGLGGAYSFVGRDGAYRDVSPVQATYRPVEDTPRAIRAVAQTAAAYGLEGILWRRDDHVSNVGRLKAHLDACRPSELGWRIHVQGGVDKALSNSSHPVATSDSDILDQCSFWCPIEPAVFAELAAAPNVCDLRFTGMDRRAHPRPG